MGSESAKQWVGRNWFQELNGSGVISPMGCRLGPWLTGWLVWGVHLHLQGVLGGDNGPMAFPSNNPCSRYLHHRHHRSSPSGIYGPHTQTIAYWTLQRCTTVFPFWISPPGEMSLHSQLNWSPFQTPLTIVRCMFSQVRHLRAKCRSLSPLNIPTMIK